MFIVSNVYYFHLCMKCALTDSDMFARMGRLRVVGVKSKQKGLERGCQPPLEAPDLQWGSVA